MLGDKIPKKTNKQKKQQNPSEYTQNNKEGHSLDCIFLLELLL